MKTYIIIGIASVIISSLSVYGIMASSWDKHREGCVISYQENAVKAQEVLDQLKQEDLSRVQEATAQLVFEVTALYANCLAEFQQSDNS